MQNRNEKHMLLTEKGAKKVALAMMALALVIALTVSLLRGSLIAGAVDEEDLANIQSSIEEAENYKASLEAEREKTQDYINSLETEKDDLETYISSIDAYMQDINDRLAELESQVETVTAQVEAAQEEVSQWEDTRQAQYEAMKLRIKYMYEEGESDFWTLFLGSGSLTDVLNRMEYVKELSAYDREQLNTYQATLETVQVKQETLEATLEELVALQTEEEAKKESQETLLAEKSSQLEAYYASIAEQQGILSDLDDSVTEQEAAIAVMQQEEEAQALILQQQIEELKKQKEAEIAAAIAKAEEERKAQEASSIAASIAASIEAEASIAQSKAEAESQTSQTEGSGQETAGTTAAAETEAPTTSAASTEGTYQLVWPTPGNTRITSSYGPRESLAAQLGTAPFHYGIDIAVNVGTKVLAATDAIVLYAGDGTKYGTQAGGIQVWLLSLDQNITTTYMHLSQALVTEGAYVQAGSVIALSGNTGTSTGAHLDFRVTIASISSNPINPLSDFITYR